MGLSSKELINRQPQGLSLNIPAGNVDGGHGGRYRNAPVHAPERMAVEMFINFLRVKGVHANDHFGKILTVSPRRVLAAAVGKPGLAKTADSLVRVYLNCYERSFIAFHTCNLHLLISPFN